MPPKVALQYGIASGNRQGIRFRKALKRAGYQFVKDSAEADIIVAHSAGCFWLPSAPSKQRLLIVGPPYWPEKTTGERGRAHLRDNLHYRRNQYRLGWWLWRNLWGTLYTLGGWKRTRLIIRTAQNFDLPSVIKGHRAVLVRNHNDSWLTPDLNDLDEANPKLIIKHLPGGHEDIWYNPKPYIELLQLLV